MQEYCRDGVGVLRYESPELRVVRASRGELIAASTLTGVTVNDGYDDGGFGCWGGVNGLAGNDGYDSGGFGCWGGVNGLAGNDGYDGGDFGCWGVNGSASNDGYDGGNFGCWGVNGSTGEPEAPEGYSDGGTGSWDLP